MKPIEKYREKFIALLQEAEEELGEELMVKVCSTRVPVPDNTNQYPSISTFLSPEQYRKEYRFEIGTYARIF